jgi:hypothetical protein
MAYQHQDSEHQYLSVFTTPKASTTKVKQKYWASSREVRSYLLEILIKILPGVIKNVILKTRSNYQVFGTGCNNVER